MCGIIGYAGRDEAAPVLLDGLERLEYRGYDSAGLALFDRGGALALVRASGKLAALRGRLLEEMEQGLDAHGTVGLGHTRWATHGAPTEPNAHPHRSMRGTYTVVHNGIIENYAVLRRELEGKGVVFASETDTEVIAQLLEQTDTGSPLETLRKALPRLEGSYALGVLYHTDPETVYCARRQSPLLAAKIETDEGTAGTLLASDAAALLPYSREVYRLEDGELGALRADGMRFYGMDGTEHFLQPMVFSRHVTAADKGGYVHFMRKEIDEQPEALRRTLAPLLQKDGLFLGQGEAALRDPDGIRRVLFLGCGSAYHAGLVGAALMEKLTGIPSAAELASEFRGRKPRLDRHCLAVVISQSGETADTLAALRIAKEQGARVLGVVNVEGSSIAQESGCVIPTQAGLEVAVATTKAYSTQLSVLYALATRLAELRGDAGPGFLREFTQALRRLPGQAAAALHTSEGTVRDWAAECQQAQHTYFLGRQLDYCAAAEAALKLKEISYIHAEAYPAGELKHGTISLIEPGTPVLAVCCQPEVAAKTRSNMEEAHARGAALYCITAEGIPHAALAAERRLVLPGTHALLTASLAALPAQLFAYHCAALKKCDIDQPRSLAKSVTVE
ncbi:MAG: glutamine--fructose-6-phosphate transaminase (isomerizing) [Oscillospiraceae bacterium]|jgi:glucosamine--fructose-6-phosphate aminotransferase (isomerizing)|nr:glutamine--fructose-6-phosphate transaminase (isomerizing) [Oscillospiraceae bacterium]